MARGKLLKNCTKNELIAEIHYLRKRNLAQSLSRVAEKAVRYGALVGIFYYIYKMVDALAGKITIADLRGILSVQGLDSATGNLTKIVIVIGLIGTIVGIGGFVYGLAQRRLRRKVIKRLSPYQQAYELQQDRSRTSSRLTAHGQTRSEDL